MAEVVTNGKIYMLWNQFVEKKAQWIGGILEDHEYSDDVLTTEITNITLIPIGEDSAYFSVMGKDFSCGFDVKVGGIIAGDPKWLNFSGYANHKWRIQTRAERDSAGVSRAIHA